MRFLRPFIGILIVNLSIDASLRLILDPFSNEELILGVIEVTSLAFALIADPMALEMITVPFR